MLAMIASSSLYPWLAPIILRQHVAQMNARDRDSRPTRNTAAGDAGAQVITAREADKMERQRAAMRGESQGWPLTLATS